MPRTAMFAQIARPVLPVAPLTAVETGVGCQGDSRGKSPGRSYSSGRCCQRHRKAAAKTVRSAACAARGRLIGAAVLLSHGGDCRSVRSVTSDAFVQSPCTGAEVHNSNPKNSSSGACVSIRCMLVGIQLHRYSLPNLLHSYTSCWCLLGRGGAASRDYSSGSWSIGQRGVCSLWRRVAATAGRWQQRCCFIATSIAAAGECVRRLQ